jgi:hypothetical protein
MSASTAHKRIATEVAAIRVTPGDPCHQCETPIADGLAWEAWHGVYCGPRCAARASRYMATVPTERIVKAAAKVVATG